MKLRMIIIKLLFLGALFIISNNNLHLGDNGEREVFFNYYSSWLGNIFNQGQAITFYVAKFEWLPKSKESYAGDIYAIGSNYSIGKGKV